MMQQYDHPISRRLRIFSADPSLRSDLATREITRITIEVPWEDLRPGPVGDYLEIVDVDPASACCYAPVDLDHPTLLASEGEDPSEDNPRFHQQMVYAVAMATIRNFERALGRSIHWAPRAEHGCFEPVQRLRIYPHALREANAYYSPSKKALLFGYFRPDVSISSVPSGVVFTCMSHDIIAHEVTHAIMDGIHGAYLEPSNPDALAFHEAFADLVALLQHFSYREVIQHQIAATRGNLEQESVLIGLAQQLGRALGNSRALRRILKRPTSVQESVAIRERACGPHERGSILVAAVFDAFVDVFRFRTRDLVRLATGGSGVLPQGELSPDLVGRLAQEASKTAQTMLTILIRALDYCPPVDITFSDYLRAMITADRDVKPSDPLGYREALIEGFRRRALYPEGVHSMTEANLRWRPPDDLDAKTLRNTAFGNVQFLRQLVPDWGFTRDRHRAMEGSNHFAAELSGWLNVSARHRGIVDLLGLTLAADAPGTITRSRTYRGFPALAVHSARPARRGTTKVDLAIELTQKRFGFFDREQQARHDAAAGPSEHYDFIFRGGCTLLVDLHTGKVRYAIGKSILSERRLEAQRAYLGSSYGSSLAATYYGTPERNFYAGERGPSEPLAMLHRFQPAAVERR